MAPCTPTDTLSTSLPSHSVSVPRAQPALVAFPFSPLSWLPISPTVCTYTRGRGCFCSSSLYRRCSVALFKHHEEHTSTTSSFNTASTCWEIKALSCLSGWIKKDLAPTAILSSPLPPCFCCLSEKLLYLERFGGEEEPALLAFLPTHFILAHTGGQDAIVLEGTGSCMSPCTDWMALWGPVAAFIKPHSEEEHRSL